MNEFTPSRFPRSRLRRTRRTAALRSLVAENGLQPADLIYPLFVKDGKGRAEAVPSMPGVERRSLDGILG